MGTVSLNGVSLLLMCTASPDGVSPVFLVFLFDAFPPPRTIPVCLKHRKEVFPVFLHTATVFVQLLLIQPKPRKPLLPTTYPLNIGQKENPLRLENPGSRML